MKNNKKVYAHLKYYELAPLTRNRHTVSFKRYRKNIDYKKMSVEYTLNNDRMKQIRCKYSELSFESDI